MKTETQLNFLASSLNNIPQAHAKLEHNLTKTLCPHFKDIYHSRNNLVLKWIKALRMKKKYLNIFGNVHSKAVTKLTQKNKTIHQKMRLHNNMWQKLQSSNSD